MQALDERPNPSSSTIKERSIKGIGMTMAGYGSIQIIRLAGNLLLSHLLAPESFGLMALVYMVILGLEMLSDVGIKQSVIRHHKELTDDFLHTAWTLQIIRALGLFFIAIALAFPVSAYYKQPILIELIPVTAISILIQGFVSTKLITNRRKINPGKEVLIEIISKSAALGVMLLVAINFPSVWVLVIGSLTMISIKLVMSHTFIPGQNDRLRWHKPTAMIILRLGVWIFLSTVFAYAAIRIDIILLGNLITLEELGVYSIGVMLAAIPRELVSRVESLVILPVFSELYRQGMEALKKNYAQSRDMILALVLIILLGAATLIPPLIYYLYDSRYLDAIWIAQLSLLVLWFPILQQIWSRVLLAIGDAKSLAISKIIQVITMFFTGLGGFHLAGTKGLIIGMAIGTISGYLFIAIKLEKLEFTCLLKDMGFTAIGLALGLFITLSPYFMDIGLAPPLLVLLIGTLITSALILYVSSRFRITRNLLKISGQSIK